MNRHLIVAGLPGSGHETLATFVAQSVEGVTFHGTDVPALSVLGQGVAATQCPDDLFRLPEIALAARERDIRLDIIVALRDPRDLLVLSGESGDIDGQTIDLVQQLIDGIGQSGLLQGVILPVRIEDLTTAPDDTADTIARRLALPRRAATRPTEPTPTLWISPETGALLFRTFTAHPQLLDLLIRQGYATDPQWFTELAARHSTPTRSTVWKARGAAGDFDILHEDDTLRVTCLDGPGDTAIITFIGVGLDIGGIDQQSEEFRKLGPGLGPQAFVFDKHRSWGNGIDMQAITRATAPLREGRQVVTLGLSMGGFLAILASGPLGAGRCIAFAPQYAMHPDIVPFERRWRAYTDPITDWRVRSLDGAFVTGCDYYALFPHDPRDLQHMRLFPDLPNVHRFAIGARDHNVATALKRNDLLYPVIWSAMRGAAPEDMPLPSTPSDGIWQVTLPDAPDP
ncbi:hypothetical protein ATO6_15895 [Oceanicola sp. 22II-s10i]|uniref:hypothetical protein n=1 Tax=Oceanicola sp. 22II-s10i TaxID=1317116 RepID=UPI000B51E9F7|nr:hypothetical protein [Oceanicola sp. 22II-s10i]OWU83898.1 hypothetical protein ATO6_15895 [Oceanicola sp. 22II-s10i]